MTKKRSARKAKLIKELSENHLVTRACSKVGIARSTYYAWMDEDPNFRYDAKAAQAKGRAKLNDFVESKLLENIRDNNQSAIAYYLRFNHPHYRPHHLRLVIEESSAHQIELDKMQRLLDELVRLKGVDALIDAATPNPEEFKKQLHNDLRLSRKRADEI